MISTLLTIAWPGLPADQLPIMLTIIYLILGVIGCRYTPIDRELMRDADLRRAKRVPPVYLAAFATVLLLTALTTGWDNLNIVIVGAAGLVVAGFAAFMTIVRLEERVRAERDRMPPPVPLDLRTFKIDQLQVTSPPYPHSSSTRGGLRLYKDLNNRTVLDLPRGSVATGTLQHNGQTLTKLVIPNRDNHNSLNRQRVAILGLDTTKQPFLLELPPEYRNRTIDECERWLLQAGEKDEIITS